MTTTKKLTVRCCRECSAALAAPKPGFVRDAKFCGISCKATWNNRRKNRGADLYDLWMAMRYDRDTAKDLGVWKEMCRLSEKWSDEDKAAKRKTYERPGVVLTRLMDTGRLPRARAMQIRAGK